MTFDPAVDLDKMRAAASNDVERLFYNHSGNLVHKWHHYLEVYDRFLSRFVGKEISVMEIGVSQGGSLQLWRSYFGPTAKIVGIDKNPNCKQFSGPQIDVHIGSQDDPVFMRDMAEQYGPFDVLIDDGSHVCSHQIKTFELMLPHVKDGGVFIVEDLHTSYWSDYGGGYRSPDSFIEYMKGHVDSMNAWYARGQPGLAVNDFTHSIFGVSFFDSMAVIEKRAIKSPFRVKVGVKHI